MRRVPRPLVLLLGVAAVLSVAWAFATAPLQGPDEVTHFAYTQTIAETGEGPAFDGGRLVVSTELDAALTTLSLGPLVGNARMRPAQTALERHAWDEQEERFGAAERGDGGPNPLARNPQLYYAYEALPYLAVGAAGGGLLDRAIAMRLWNIPILLLAVAVSWLLAVELFGAAARLRVVLATAIVALWPMVTFMAGVVNPDIALLALVNLTLLLALRVVRRGASLGRVLALCGSAAAAMLVHGRGLPAVGVAAVALALVLARAAAPRARVLAAVAAAPLRRLLGWVAAGAAVLLALVGISRVLLPSGAGGGLYGSEVSFPTQQASIGGLVNETLQFYVGPLGFLPDRLGGDFGYRQVMVERFFGGIFGSLDVLYPLWAYTLVKVAVAATAVATLVTAVRRRVRLRAQWPTVLVLAALPAGLLALLHLASYRALLGGPDALITGRYLLPLAPLCALTVAWVVGALPAKLRPWLAGGALGALLILQLGGLGATVLRFHV